MQKYIIALAAITAAILVSPKPVVQGGLKLAQVRTVSSKTFPSSTIQEHGAWFCEAVQ